MTLRKFLAATAVLTAAVGAGVLTFDRWRDWLPLSRSVDPGMGAEVPGHAHGTAERVRLSPQALKNLQVQVRAVRMEPFWRTIQVPGTIVERPGKGDRVVTAPAAGVLTRIATVPGDAVQPGTELFVIRLNSEHLQNDQTDLYKTVRELQITLEQKQRFERAAGAIPEARLMEIEFQQRRLQGTLQTLRHDLEIHGFTREQIQGIEELARRNDDRPLGTGGFVKEIVIRAPGLTATAAGTDSQASASDTPAPLYEIEDLKVQIGDQVQVGQVLCLLGNHETLYIEGRAFKSEVPLLEQVTQEGRPVRAEFVDDAASQWPTPTPPLTIQFLGNKADPSSQTVPFYLSLTNQSREYRQSERTYRTWRYRPGQRVRLRVPVEQFPASFVLPVSAVVREGGDVYVFRQNGPVFDRKAVHVLHEDRLNVVLANDGSISAGNVVAVTGAAALNRALKAQAAGEEGHGHGHSHHGHSHDH